MMSANDQAEPTGGSASLIRTIALRSTLNSSDTSMYAQGMRLTAMTEDQ